MGMIHSGYEHMAEDWRDRAQSMERLGHNTHAEFARSKEEIWLEFSQWAKQEFNALVPGVIV